jgi:hypothetical protein
MVDMMQTVLYQSSNLSIFVLPKTKVVYHYPEIYKQGKSFAMLSFRRAAHNVINNFINLDSLCLPSLVHSQVAHPFLLA